MVPIQFNVRVDSEAEFISDSSVGDTGSAGLSDETEIRAIVAAIEAGYQSAYPGAVTIPWANIQVNISGQWKTIEEWRATLTPAPATTTPVVPSVTRADVTATRANNSDPNGTGRLTITFLAPSTDQSLASDMIVSYQIGAGAVQTATGTVNGNRVTFNVGNIPTSITALSITNLQSASVNGPGEGYANPSATITHEVTAAPDPGGATAVPQPTSGTYTVSGRDVTVTVTLDNPLQSGDVVQWSQDGTTWSPMTSSGTQGRVALTVPGTDPISGPVALQFRVNRGSVNGTAVSLNVTPASADPAPVEPSSGGTVTPAVGTVMTTNAAEGQASVQITGLAANTEYRFRFTNGGQTMRGTTDASGAVTLNVTGLHRGNNGGASFQIGVYPATGPMRPTGSNATRLASLDVPLSTPITRPRSGGTTVTQTTFNTTPTVADVSGNTARSLVTVTLAGPNLPATPLPTVTLTGPTGSPALTADNVTVSGNTLTFEVAKQPNALTGVTVTVPGVGGTTTFDLPGTTPSPTLTVGEASDPADTETVVTPPAGEHASDGYYTSRYRDIQARGTAREALAMAEEAKERKDFWWALLFYLLACIMSGNSKMIDEAALVMGNIRRENASANAAALFEMKATIARQEEHLHGEIQRISTELAAITGNTESDRQRRQELSTQIEDLRFQQTQIGRFEENLEMITRQSLAALDESMELADNLLKREEANARSTS